MGEVPAEHAVSREDLIDQLVTAGRALATTVTAFQSAAAEKAGLSWTEAKAMDLVDRLGPLTAGELAELAGLTTGAVTGLVDRLERKGFASRTRHPTDRRLVLIKAAPGSAGRVHALLTAWVGELPELSAAYDAPELETVLGFLRRTTDRQLELLSGLGYPNTGLHRGPAGSRGIPELAARPSEGAG